MRATNKHQGTLFEDADAALRTAWRDLVERRLPEAARGRGWPIHLDHCFARVLLDNACGRPWREAIRAPAWRNAPPETLRRAIALGEAALAGEADMAALNRRSLVLRGKTPRR
ncbi:MAG: GCN5-related N-acetyltransferase [Pseudomonadota bacterium]